MKSLSIGLIALLIVLPGVSWAQSNSTARPNPPASWAAFLQQENAKRAAFFKQLKEDRDAFIGANPEVKAYFDQMRQSGQARMSAWRTLHPRKHSANPSGGPAL